MLKNIQLRIDTPCSANWNQMTTGEQGRFCSSCKKTVVDFTGMSDQQVLHWFSRPHEGVCGRLEGDQLNRGLIPQSGRRNSQPGLWSYLLAGLLVSSEASAQDKPVSPSISQQDSINPDKVVKVGKVSVQSHRHSSERELPDTLRGRLVDSSNGLPISYATITIDSHHGYSANEKGYFVIPRTNLAAGNILKISALGYTPLTIDVTKIWTDDQQEKVLSLCLSQTMMGDVVIVRRTRHKKAVSFLKDSLAFTGLTQKTLTVYPNPVSRGAAVTLSMRLEEPGTYSAQLFNTSGVLIETVKVEGSEKSKNVLMDIPPTLLAGTYFIRLSHPALKKVYTQELAVF